MGDQKNLILAIVLSVGIIVIFQFLFPQQYMTPPPSEKIHEIENATSINDTKKIEKNNIISKEEVINQTKRIAVKTPSLTGSINLKGAILDDLILSKYKESLDENSKSINLFSPEQTSNPYFVEIGWGKISNNSFDVELPNSNTEWISNRINLTPESPITLEWTNKQNITFKIHYEVDNNYLFNITQEIENNSTNDIEIFPYRLIKRINFPKTINFFILHEGLISVLDEELIEKKYDKLVDDCSILKDKKDYCFKKNIEGGWFGFTDKYWMSTLIPDQKENINVDFIHNKNNRDIFKVGYAGNNITIKKNSINTYSGKLFAGAKVLKILNQYQKEFNIPRFNDAIDWGWFSFLTKPIFYAINWFYGLIKNFGLAIVAFTFIMRLILFPLAHTSFKSMAKMKKLQPEMQRLKETYPNDRQKMQQELMTLYKREGANPVAGCLPILVQIPIFFSLYKVLFVTIEMYHAPFYGWIHDLSAPDPLGILTAFGLIKWNVPNILSIANIGILPILMGFTMWLQQKLNPAPTDPTQAKIFAVLPFVFTFILAGFAAGLVLYWTVNNILSIAQQWLIQRKILAGKNG